MVLVRIGHVVFRADKLLAVDEVLPGKRVHIYLEGLDRPLAVYQTTAADVRLAVEAALV